MSNSEPLVSLQRGFVVPVAVFNLVLQCEQAGIRLGARDGVLDVEGRLTPEVIAELKRWKPHVLALLAYTPTDAHLFDDTIPAPLCGPVSQVSK